ncbi:MAG: hypothetical protein JOZ94_05195 [Xanthobacteraceae bacterium]|nr:hypothetical protein [Xanthobacteraceae bacterium]MBV9235208.1 hypothetical protein [Xanthobacteraceae bacterium]
MLNKAGSCSGSIAGLEHILGAPSASRSGEIATNGRLEHGGDLRQRSARWCQRSFEIGRPRRQAFALRRRQRATQDGRTVRCRESDQRAADAFSIPAARAGGVILT